MTSESLNDATNRLFVAVEKADLPATKQAIADGAYINALDENGQTPLMWAADENSPECIDLLLKAGVDANLADSEGNTALHCLHFYQEVPNALAALKLLLDAGANPNAQCNIGRTPLIDSIQESEAVRLMLEHGADPNIVSKADECALSYCAVWGWLESAKLLIDHKVNINWIGRGGNTALAFAADQGREAIVDVLLEAGADPNQATDGGETALMLAIFKGHQNIALKLVKCTKNIDQVNNHNEIARDLAIVVRNKMDQIIEILDVKD